MSEKYDVAVIGSGSGGSEAALLAAGKGSKAIVIEKDAFGGTRFHRGCYAVRALRASSRVFQQIIQSKQFGIEADVLRSSLVGWMDAQRAASARLAEDLRHDLQTLERPDSNRNWKFARRAPSEDHRSFRKGGGCRGRVHHFGDWVAP